MSMSDLPSTYSERLFEKEPHGQIRRAAELGDALGDLVRIDSLLVGMLEKLLGHGARVNALRHVVVPLVAEHADESRS